MKNIVLIGMSGAGKSTLGVLLAKALGLDFTDTDILIQQREGMRLQEIIDSRGIEYFLKREEEAILSFDKMGYVIATGGSAVYSDKAMSALKNSGITVYLYVSSGELKARLTNITTRGIVMEPGCSLDELIVQRLPLYEKYADITVDCSGKDIEACIGEIIDSINKSEGLYI